MFGKRPHQLRPPAATLTQLTWKQVMEVSPVLEGTSEHARKVFLAALANNAGKGLALALETASVISSNGTLVVEFAESARALRGVKLMVDQAGRQLPTLIRDGKTVANARVVGGAAQLTNTVAAAAGATVVVAHMISGADNARKLQQANQKLDFLIVARRLDQCARMEAVFRQAKELLALPDSPETHRELHRMGMVLHELRASWRNEVRHKLSEVDPKKPDDASNWFMRRFRRFRENANDQRAASEAYQNLAELHLMNVSLGLHVCLAQASGTLDAFLRHSLPEEVALTRGLMEQVGGLRQQINATHTVALDRIRETERAVQRTLDVFEPMAIRPADGAFVDGKLLT